jgi:hypothetical protein
LSLGSTAVQLKHLPPGPWLHLLLAAGACLGSVGFVVVAALGSGVGPKQFKHFPPGGWLHLGFFASSRMVLTLTPDAGGC